MNELRECFELDVIRAVMRLKQLKGEDRILKEGDRLYSHTNTRGRKRFIQICKNYDSAKSIANSNDGSFFKSWSSWVCLYE